jgi:sugar-specific transcriptional regulator TrmB
MQAHILEKLWLSKEESQIYLFLIKNPKQTISDLSNKLLINRPKLYTILPAMIESWLIW